MQYSGFIEILENNIGKVPHTVKQAFEGVECKSDDALGASKEIYLDSILTAIKKRPKDKMSRYFILARIIFSYINFIYELMERINTEEKIKFVVGKENYLTKNINSLFLNSVTILVDNRPENYIMEKNTINDTVLKYYDIIFSILLKKNPEIHKLFFTNYHFKEKIIKGKHLMFSRDILKAYNLAFGRVRSVSPVLVTIESVIHGIDDYVDVQDQPYEKFFSDTANIILGLFGILIYTFMHQQKDIFNNVSYLLKKKTKIEMILESMKESLIDLTWTPFVEKNITKILKAKTKKEEYALAVENLETRTRGTTKTLTEPIHILLNINSDDAAKIAELMWILRVKQMLHKDIIDIETDLKNMDFKATTIWAKRYMTKNKIFRERVKYLNDIYYSKSMDMEGHLMKKYPDATEFLMNEITKAHENIVRAIGDTTPLSAKNSL
jgi:hypothetical protein